MGGDSQHLKKTWITNGEVPLLGGSLSETVPLYQLRDIDPLVQNLFPNVKVGNFPLAGRLL